MKMLFWLLQFRYRTHGNELWEFDDNGLMCRRDMSANDIPILEEERRHRPPTCV
jgi:nuclear transport factor 2 (NTF2) superfamily protein